MTNSIGEIEGSELLFVIGANPPAAHPIIGNKMKKAVKNGTKLIVVDPRRTELAQMADYWVPVNSGTDAALVNGLMHIILREGWEDKEFLEKRCTGLEYIKEIVKEYPPEVVARITGVTEEMLYNVAELYAKTDKAGVFYTLGITEHTTGTANVMNLANLCMLTGHLGKESSGINPMRGQNNVQGACDQGALPNSYPGYPKVEDPKARAFFEELWGVELNPKNGLRIPEMLDDAHDGTLRAMYVMGEEPVLTDPDANHVKAAMNNLEFLVVQDIFLTETAKLADVVFPATCYAEKDGTFTNTERRVQRVRKAANPPGQARLDYQILSEVARGLGAKGFDYRSAEDIFEEMRKAMPSYRGMTYERLGNVGLSWPCPTIEHPGTKFLHKGTFPIGKGVMLPVEYEPPAELTCDDYPILLSTGRMLYHYNIMTRHSNTLDTIRPHELAEIHPREAKELGIEENEIVRVTSRRGSILTHVTITDKVKPGMVFMTFHYKESPVNELTNSAADPVTLTAEYKVCAIKVEKATEADLIEAAELGL